MTNHKKIQKSMVQQHDYADCGVACLQSILRFHGSDISLEQLRVWSGATRSGTTMLGLNQAAKKAGLEAEGYEADIQNLKECRDICILHVLIDNRAHYLVYWGYDVQSKKYIIGDPGKGIIEMYSETLLDRLWVSKYLILIRPQKLNQPMQLKKYHLKWKWLADFIKPDFNILITALFLGILVSVLGLSTAIFSQKLIDDILPSESWFKLFAGILLLIILLLVRIGLGYVRQVFLLRQAKDFNIRIIDYFINRLLNLPKYFFDTRRTGDMVARMNDSSKIQSAVTLASTSILIDALLTLTATIVAFFYHWESALIILIWIPIYIGITARFSKIIVNNQRQVMIDYANTESSFIDTIQSAGTIKLVNRQDLFARLIKMVNTKYQESAFSMGRTAANLSFWTEFAGATLICSILVSGSIFVMQNDMSVGVMFVLLQISSLVINSSARLGMANIQLQEAKVAFERMSEFATLQTEFNQETDKKLVKIEAFQELCAERIFFRFPGRNLLLKDISMTIRRGEMVIVHGKTGSGKSTLLQIFQKFYKIDNGLVKINGTDIDKISTMSWRACLGVVEQETNIFNGTIADNILLGDVLNDDQILTNFLEQHGFNNFFKTFPQGVNTLVGKSGIILSGGQKQLIGIARALWRKPHLLLLDEPTAALDIQTEKFVFNLLNNLKTDMGILLLTHREEAAVNADAIYRIDCKVMEIA